MIFLHHHFYLNIIIIKTLNNTQQSNYDYDVNDDEYIGGAECLYVVEGLVNNNKCARM